LRGRSDIRQGVEQGAVQVERDGARRERQRYHA
jgi:hypothetical protein